MKISIITINLNNARGLKKTISSVCTQIFPDIEYIIIDGNSTDESVAIIENSADHLNYWISEKDSGMYLAMNKGIAKATGDYLLFLNSGDTLTNSESIKNAVDLFNKEDIIYGNINIVCNDQIVRTETYPYTLNFNYFISGAIPHQGMFIKKSVFTRIGLYDENLKICSDWKFQVDAICKFKCSYKHIDLIISDFSGDGISSDEENQPLIQKEKESVLINEYSLLKEDLELLKEYNALSYYYRNSNRVKLLKRWGILKDILAGK